MTSRHLYFKLLKEDMKRKLWAAALLGLSLFFAMPVALAMAFSNIQMEETIIWAEVLRQRRTWAITMLGFGTGYPMTFVILFVAALVLGISTFAYLHNKKQIDFYHSLPVKRELWFLVHISTGIFLPAVIYLLSLAMALVVCGVSGAFTAALIPAAAVGYLGNMLFYILVYMTMVLAMMMTGTRLAAILGSGVFFLYCPMVSGLVIAFYEMFFDTYYSNAPSVWSGVVIKISPMFALITAMTDGLNLWRIAGSMGAILVVGLLSFFFYLKRPSEAAGKTMAFRKSMGVIKVLLVVAFGMAGGMFFYSIRSSLPWMVFGVIVGVVISHCVIEVIYHLDFKKLFCHEKTMALCMTASLAISLTFYFDLFGYDDYLPEEGSVAYASIDFGEDSWVSYNVIMKPSFSVLGGRRILDLEQLSATGAVLDIAQEGIRQLDLKNPSDEYKQWSNVVVCYTLKNGRRVYRRYNMFLDTVMAQADEIYQNPEYKKALYPGLALDPEEAAGNIAYLNEMDQVELLAGNQEGWKAVAEAYQQELMEMTMTRREQESPIGELLLISDEFASRIEEVNVERELRRYERQYWYEGFFYPIYPSFTRTIAALEDCGITVGESLRPEALGAVQISAYGPFGEDEDQEEFFGKEYDNEPFTITYRDPEQIQAIMENFSFSGHRDKNDMVLCSRYRVYPIAKEYDIAENLEERDYYSGGSSRGQLVYGKVPDFVIRDFEAMWEEWKKQ